MAGNIQKVNLNNLKKEGEEFEWLIYDVYSQTVNIEKALQSVSKTWTGKRINTIIALWNSNYKSLNSITVDYLYLKVYSAIRQIQEQYLSMEAGKPLDSKVTSSVMGVNKIALTDETTIKYDQAKANAFIKDINNYYQALSADLKKLSTKLDPMSTYSDSLKSLTTNFKAYTSSLEKTINSIVSNVQTEAQKAVSDVNVTEQYNEADAKRAATTSTK